MAEPAIRRTPGRGRFISFEGGEGVGKSTQSLYLLDLLRSLGIDAILTREPGGSEGADQIRQLLVTGLEDRWDPLSETLLLFAARRDHVNRTIIPAMQAGVWVITDRFYDSTVAYQGYGHGINLDLLNRLNGSVNGRLQPDLTFILDAPSSVGISRALERGGLEDRYERLVENFHDRARLGFRKIVAENPSRCRLIDATNPIEVTKEQIAQIVLDRFKLHRMKRSISS